MGFLPANTHTPLFAQSLSKKLIKPFLKDLYRHKAFMGNQAEHISVKSGCAILWAAKTYPSPSRRNC